MKNKIKLLYSRATGIPKFCFFLSCCAFPLFFTKLYRLFLIVNIKLTASFLPQLKDFFSWIFFARGKSEEWPLEDLQSPLLLPDPTLMSPRKKNWPICTMVAQKYCRLSFHFCESPWTGDDLYIVRHSALESYCIPNFKTFL